MQPEPVLRTGFQELWGYDLLFQPVVLSKTAGE